MLILYQIVVLIATPLLKVGRFFNQKLKVRWAGEMQSWQALQKIPPRENRTCLWFHCASLGEFELTRPLLETLKKRDSSLWIALTFFSPSGYEVQKNYNHADWIGYLPFDQKRRIKTFLKTLDPDLAFFVKYEFWPNTLQQLKQASIPTFSLCGRFYPSQFFFKRYGKWMLQLLRNLDGFLVVDQQSEILLQQQGFKKLVRVGDLRMDRVLYHAQNAQPLPEVAAFLEQKKAFVLGSSWPEDYPLLLPYLLTKTDCKIIIAPHEVHPKSIAKLKMQLADEPALWSTFDLAKDCQKRILILDTIGLLAQLYQYAHWAYVGGGMGTKGLHNILEAVVYGVPVFIGKNYQNFIEAEDLVEQKGVFSVHNEVQFKAAFEAVSPKEYNRIKQINQNYVAKHSGATQKSLSFLESFLSS